jgi:hypothetical protein
VLDTNGGIKLEKTKGAIKNGQSRDTFWSSTKSFNISQQEAYLDDYLQ